MNFLKRAITSIVRRLGKTIILFLLVFILASVIVGAVSVRGAINNTDANLRRNMQPIVTIHLDSLSLHEYVIEWQTNSDFDWNNFNPETIDISDPSTFPPSPQIQFLTASDVRAIGSLDYVVNLGYSIVDTLFSFDLDPYGDALYWGFGDEEVRWLNVRGTSEANLMQIEQGALDLVQGSQFSQDDLVAGQERSVAIISEPFARVNNLTIGSIFSMYNFITYPDEYGNTLNWGITEDDGIYAQVGMEFEVVGLYDILIDSEARLGFWGTDSIMGEINTIYIPNWTIEDIATRTLNAERSVWDAVDMEIPFSTWLDLQAEQVQTGTLTSLFVLNDPTETESFKATAAELLPPHHYFVDLSNTFEPIASSMEMMGDIADWVLYSSIGATLLILGLLIILFLHDRRYEMGVYLALGEKKGKIIIQVLTEVVVTSFVAITFAIFVGSLTSRVISQNMLETELIARYEQSMGEEHSFWWTEFERFGVTVFSQTMTPEEMAETFEIPFGVETIILFYVIGLGVVILSTMGAITYIVRLNPKKVLM